MKGERVKTIVRCGGRLEGKNSPPASISSPGHPSDVYYFHFFDKHLLWSMEVNFDIIVQ